MIRSIKRTSALLVALLVLAGCSVAPAYERPAVDTPAAFKEAVDTDPLWKPAQPAEAAARGEWWKCSAMTP